MKKYGFAGNQKQYNTAPEMSDPAKAIPLIREAAYGVYENLCVIVHSPAEESTAGMVVTNGGESLRPVEKSVFTDGGETPQEYALQFPSAEKNRKTFSGDKQTMRKPIIAGNWKMNNTASEGVALVKAIAPLVENAGCDVVVCVPAIDIPAVGEALKGTNIALGAENVHYAEKGAFTGEISAAMLKEYNVEYVIVGHSERRQYFGETDETVNKRTLAALAAGLTPIVCIGESLEERETGRTEEVLAVQIREGLKGIEDVKKIVIAYEPVWAIGTGKTATAEQANETIGFIRKTIGEMFCPKCAEALRIQYGGSMNAKNCKELMAMPEIDGGLIGGASLKAPDFAAIVNYDK